MWKEACAGSAGQATTSALVPALSASCRAKVVTPMPAASASSRNRSACRLSAPSTSDFALTMIWRVHYRYSSHVGCSIGLMWSGEMFRNVATSNVSP